MPSKCFTSTLKLFARPVRSNRRNGRRVYRRAARVWTAHGGVRSAARGLSGQGLPALLLDAGRSRAGRGRGAGELSPHLEIDGPVSGGGGARNMDLFDHAN